MKQTLAIFLAEAGIRFYLVFTALGLVACWATGAWVHWPIALGILLASPLIEFVLHRYVLHCPVPRDRVRFARLVSILDQIHYQHHRDPKDLAHIFAQVWLTLPAIVTTERLPRSHFGEDVIHGT